MKNRRAHMRKRKRRKERIRMQNHYNRVYGKLNMLKAEMYARLEELKEKDLKLKERVAEKEKAENET